MNTRKFSYLFFLLACILILMVACAKEASPHPEGFDAYSVALAKPMATAKKELKLEDTDLTAVPETKGLHRLSKKVVFHNIPFDAYLLEDVATEYLFGFEYKAELTGDSKETVREIHTLVQALESSLGSPLYYFGCSSQDSFSSLTSPELEAWFTGEKGGSKTAQWSLGKRTGEKDLAYRELLMAADKNHVREWNDAPILLMELIVSTDGSGTARITLHYTLEFFGDWDLPLTA